MEKNLQAPVKKIVPDPKTFLLKTPTYQGFIIDDDNYLEILRLEFYNRTIDCFCQKCNKEGTFQRSNNFVPKYEHPIAPKDFDLSTEIESNEGIPFTLLFHRGDENKYQREYVKDYALEERYFIVEFVCTRCRSQRILFFFMIEDSRLIKIGQYPSILDLENHAIHKYEILLGKEKTSEFNIAIRLFANGLGIGSFVYLRRIFEYLIELAHEEAKPTKDWEENLFYSTRWEEKVLLLKDYLPPLLIESRKIYSVLSKGIHDLSEDECKSYFDPLKLLIELILDQRIAQIERIKKEKDAKIGLSKIIGNIKT